MPQYMRDTDTVSFALRGQGRVAARLLEHRPSQLCISLITLAALRFGAEARRSRKLHRLVGTFVEAEGGEPIGTFDTLMAAHALSLGLTFVTNNAKHFGRVVGLETEN
jgi:tRNA(fMet)-specific endonuclease VapC